MIRHCIFDFDGTLADTLDDVLACMKTAFQKTGHPVESIRVPVIMQLQLREAVASLIPQSDSAQIDAVIAAFRAVYDASDYPATRLMPGVTGLLAALREQSVGMTIVSNKRHFPTMRILDKFGITAFFDEVYNPDMFPGLPFMTKARMIGRAMTEHRLAKETTIYIGDSEPDVAAADENGLASVIVANGFGSIESFKRQPTHVVAEISGILDIPGLFPAATGMPGR